MWTRKMKLKFPKFIYNHTAKQVSIFFTLSKEKWRTSAYALLWFLLPFNCCSAVFCFVFRWNRYMKSGSSMLAGFLETTRHVLWRIYSMHMLIYFQLLWKWNWGRNKLNGTVSEFRIMTLRSYIRPPAFWVLVFWTLQLGNFVWCDTGQKTHLFVLTFFHRSVMLYCLLCYWSASMNQMPAGIATHWDITKKQWFWCSPLWTANPDLAKTTF